MLMRYRQLGNNKKTVGESLGLVSTGSRLLGLFITSVVRLITTSLVIGCVIGGYYLYTAVNRTISSVEITAANHNDLRFVDELSIKADLDYLQGKRLLTVNIVDVEALLMKSPWISNASVKRRWPDKLQISLIEHRPLAHWKLTDTTDCSINYMDCGFVSTDGLLIRMNKKQSKNINSYKTLEAIQLIGDFNQDDSNAGIIEQYSLIKRLINQTSLSIVHLNENQYGAITLKTDDGIGIKLGSTELINKMNRVVYLWNKDLHHKRLLIKTIDARYPHGVAIEWKVSTNQRV